MHSAFYRKVSAKANIKAWVKFLLNIFSNILYFAKKKKIFYFMFIYVFFTYDIYLYNFQKEKLQIYFLNDLF